MGYSIERPVRQQAEAPRKLAAHEFEAAAGALARAFFDDPLIRYFFPADEQRRRLSPYFFRGAIRLAHPEGHSFTAEDAPAGAALWLPPGRSKIPMGRLAKVILPDLWRYGFGPMRRLISVLDEFEKLHPKEAHWYLMVLGVEPDRQGQGLGGVLMSDVLRQADASGVPAYLETQKSKNVPFYEKHGFQVVEHFECHGGRGPESWTMLRQPSSN
jgi:GNAT superfamily N-acetyltransferase